VPVLINAVPIHRMEKYKDPSFLPMNRGINDVQVSAKPCLLPRIVATVGVPTVGVANLPRPDEVGVEEPGSVGRIVIVDHENQPPPPQRAKRKRYIERHAAPVPSEQAIFIMGVVVSRLSNLVVPPIILLEMLVV